MTIEQALALSARLKDVSDSARLDVELLLCHVLQQPRSYLFTWPDYALSEVQQIHFDVLFERRTRGEPVAHILGYRHFWTLELEVTPDTLIPRPDTEVLVEQALARLPDAPCRIADLGTGTGAIALALASERPQSEVIGCDRIDAAAALAQRNADRLGIGNARFVCGSWFTPLAGRFQMIVSNPPYIDPEDPHLDTGDVRYEPRSALVAEDAGLADIRLIVDGAPDYLEAGGWLLLEHGYDQGEAVRGLLQSKGYAEVETVVDYGGRERVTLGRWMEGKRDAE